MSPVSGARQGEARIGYVLKVYPRFSETFTSPRSWPARPGART